MDNAGTWVTFEVVSEHLVFLPFVRIFTQQALHEGSRAPRRQVAWSSSPQDQPRGTLDTLHCVCPRVSWPWQWGCSARLFYTLSSELPNAEAFLADLPPFLCTWSKQPFTNEGMRRGLLAEGRTEREQERSVSVFVSFGFARGGGDWGTRRRLRGKGEFKEICRILSKVGIKFK